MQCGEIIVDEESEGKDVHTCSETVDPVTGTHPGKHKCGSDGYEWG